MPEEFVPATVPGAVQLDWACAKSWPEYWKADHYKMFGWMEAVGWLYRANMPAIQRAENQEVWWVLSGVEYEFSVWVDGVEKLRQEGMFRPVEILLAGAGEPLPSLLEVRIAPPPMKEGAPVGRFQADQVCKPPYSYGWDWQPRLIPSGIWEETWIECRPVLHLREVKCDYILDAGLTSAAIQVKATLSREEKTSLRVRLTAPNGEVVLDQTSAGPNWSGSLANPELWWPHDHGSQPLYEVTVEIVCDGKVLDLWKKRIAFRRVRLVGFDNQKSFRVGMPAGEPTAPLTLEINGRKIFSKGSNWVPPEVFPGIVTEETYRPLLQLARDAHMNILRHWGGGYIQKESFYSLCDEMGLMVWQEFPLSCLAYADDTHYLKILDQESRAILRRLESHACVVLWCGGNELYNSWSGADMQTKALRLLNRNCYDAAPDIPFLPTSPVAGILHGDYRFRNPDRQEVFQIFAATVATGYCEFGVSACSPVEVLESFLPADQLWPPRTGTCWEDHHAFGAWDVDATAWLMLPLIEEYFGPQQSLEELAANSSWLQCSGYQFIFEEARRQKPICSMAINWCYNEPWPTAANNSLVNWPARPRPSLDAVRAALRPTLASLRMPKFVFKPGEKFEAQVCLLHDGPASLPNLSFTIWLSFPNGRHRAGAWECPPTQPNTNQEGPILTVELPPAMPKGEFFIEVELSDHSEWNSRYRHLMK